MKQFLVFHLSIAFVLAISAHSLSANREPFNVLFISIDDLRPELSAYSDAQTKTPQLDRFIEEGAYVFQNAHCPAPVCGPSRSAILSGFMPYRTGLYTNKENMLDSKLVQKHPTLPEYFFKHGYHTLSRGKIFHAHATSKGSDYGHWAFEEWYPKPKPPAVKVNTHYSIKRDLIAGKKASTKNFKPMPIDFAWGQSIEELEDTADYKVASWAHEQLQRKFDKPFFLAVGIDKPHLPFVAPKEFYEMYDTQSIKVPAHFDDDLNDILTPKGAGKYRPTPDYEWLDKHDLKKEAMHAYLAACSYADACLGVIFDGLKKSAYYDNTIVVIWGDHGWHFGEKLRYRKGTPWQVSTHVPLIVKLPGQSEAVDCFGFVNLIDLYPFLVDLCGLPKNKALDGKSFRSFLETPRTAPHQTTMTIFGHNNISLVNRSWRYIRHADQTEELYNRVEDPQELDNLMQRALTQKQKFIVKELQAIIPQHFAPPVKTIKFKKKQKSEKIDNTLKKKRLRIVAK